MSSRDGESEKAIEDREFAAELERRLEIIEAPDYENPAGRDLPRVDLLVFAVLGVLVVVLVHVWGY